MKISIPSRGKRQVLGCILLSLFVAACGGSGNNAAVDSDADTVADTLDNCITVVNLDQHDADQDGVGDACEADYRFVDSAGNDTVSYTGQTARHVLINELLIAMTSLTRSDPRSVQQILDQQFHLYYNNRQESTDTDNVLDGEPIRFSLAGSASLVTNTNNPSDLTLASISPGKNLKDKLAGNDKCHHILAQGNATAACADGERGEFVGWNFGLSADPLVRTPNDLITFLFQSFAEEASSDQLRTIATVASDVTPVSSANVNALGHDFVQLIQKFLLGALTFSQATADYLSDDFSSEANLALREGKFDTEGQHNWDEAFGYYGAARNAASYTDLEARAKSGRESYRYGYNDTNGDNLIDVRAEVMLGNSVNCAKRDAGSAGNASPTSFTEDAFDAFISGRKILQEAGDAGQLSEAMQANLDAHILQAAQTWEKCIAATVVHYINDLLTDITKFVDGKFADLDNYYDYAKHWSEMKGFALGLQFSPFSPFRQAGSGYTIYDLQTVLQAMGDAPVLADGSQLGQPYQGGIASYQQSLLSARDTLQDVYGFDSENVSKW